ncbi:transaldolase family protein [Curtobacterium sp. BRD11]|uniref:transaldolase family protein n=1 Tax=Curtobacterium sp. BRD11 TaxID=2962581 RepID=UPI0028826AD7|nr:transaldolase family protein [Curtobacterium sp. BRD11]MDT0212068.1 transaldolase family protein [Curtobacterium sp. BRD11]
MLFLDSASPTEFARWYGVGAVDGLTSNPSILARGTARTDWDATYVALLEVAPLAPVSIEVLSEDPRVVVEQARAYHQLGSNVVIKVPVAMSDHDTRGALALIKDLASEGIKVNATAVFSPLQALLAAKAGARYVSIFAGRLLDRDIDATETISNTRRLLDVEVAGVEMIAASVRHPGNISSWLRAGAHIVTVPESMMDKALLDPRTLEVVGEFRKARESA